MTADPRHLIAESLSAERAPTEADVRKLIVERLRPDPDPEDS